MRRSVIVLLLLFVPFVGSSQILISLIFGEKLNSERLEFGLEGGANFSSISGLETDKNLTAFNLGFYFDITLKDKLSLYTGVLVKSKQGARKLTNFDLLNVNSVVFTDPGDYRQIVKSFQVPVLLKYKLKVPFYFEGGVQLGLAYDGYVEFNYEIDDQETRIRTSNKSDINAFDIGLVGGFGYQFIGGRGITIGAKYCQGLFDTYKNIKNTKNNTVMLKVNIPIGAKDVEKAIEKEFDVTLPDNAPGKE